MAAKDKFHEVLKKALVKDGWTVTDAIRSKNWR